MTLLDQKVEPDFEALRRCILREGTPARVHFIELFQDAEIKDATAARFELERGLDRGDQWFDLQRELAIQRFLGYDMVRAPLAGYGFSGRILEARETTTFPGQGRETRGWQDEHVGPIAGWEDFERFPWPAAANADTRPFEWLEKNLPDGMAWYTLCGHILENVTMLLGYESLCLKLYEEPELVDAVLEEVGRRELAFVELLCQFPRLGVVWASDDMGFKTQTLIPPDILREKFLPWHRRAAEVAHARGKPYLLHACGNLDAIAESLIEDVRIDARHSFEDVISPVTAEMARYGDRVAHLGGIDVDFLCRADEKRIRQRVQETLDACQPGGGYCLGTGNTVANYIPLENYLIMLDEGRRYGAS